MGGATTMASSDSDDLARRVAELERVVAELLAHVQRLEQALGARQENPTDRAAVQRRVLYDWQ